MLAAVLLACTAEPQVPPADLSRLREGLGLGVIPRVPAETVLGTASPYEGYNVWPISVAVYDHYRASGALWLPDGPGPYPAVLVAHGHFGEGKSSGEVQGPAHALAANGYVVLALDTPGVEEAARWDRQIHFDLGAPQRHLLAAAGTSALAVQLEHLQAGLDVLEELPQVDAQRIGVTGASGGAVQSLYLTLIDERPKAAALASFVPMPREARAGGCACDAVHGWPGPDAALLAATRVPTLWLSEVPQERPEGLPRGARFEVVEGPHGYEPPMIEQALDFFGDELGGGDELPTQIAHTPGEALRSVSVGKARFADLVAPLEVEAGPRQEHVYDYTLECSGQGEQVLLLLGGEAADLAALQADFRVCAVDVPLTPVDLSESLITRRWALDGMANAVARAHQRERAAGVYAVRGWGLVAERAELPYVLRDPILGLDDLRKSDPPWVSSPGVWWSELYPSALAVSSEPQSLRDPLLDATRPRPEADPPSPP